MMPNIRYKSIYTLIIPFVLIGCAIGVHVHHRNGGQEIHYPTSKLSVTIPDDGFVQKENRRGGGTNLPSYFYFVKNSPENFIIISGWFMPREYFTSIDDIKGKRIQPGDQNVEFVKVDKWSAFIYDVPIPNRTNSHISAHWLQADTWIDLHVSITTATSYSKDARIKLLGLLKSIQVKELQSVFTN